MSYYNAGFYNTGVYPYQGMPQYEYPVNSWQSQDGLDNTYQSLFSNSRSLLDQPVYPKPEYTPFSFTQSQPAITARRSQKPQANKSSYDDNRSLFEKEMLALDKRNRYFSNYFDSSSSGLSTASCSDIMTPQLAAAILKYNFKLLDTALGEKRNGVFNKEDLKTIANKKNNKGLPQNLKDAAKYLLDNEAVFNQIDSECNGETDGLISMEDLKKYFGEMSIKEAAQVLLDHIRTLDTADPEGAKKDDKFGKNDLKSIANDKNAIKELKKAANLFLKNQSAYNIIDSALNGKVDGNVVKGDLEKAIKDDLLKSFE